MHATSSANSPIGRKIETLLIPRSLAPRVYRALQALGYSLSDRAAKSDRIEPNLQADVAASAIWVVDESRIDEMPEIGDAQILLIGSPQRNPSTDPRILAHVIRPARLSDVYSMIQGALESRSRRNPRVRTKLSARCLRADRCLIGAVLSLSERGCLLRTDESIQKGARLRSRQHRGGVSL